VALSALREGDLVAAEAIVQRLLHSMPDDPAVHQLAAVVALQRGETEQAERSAAGRCPEWRRIAAPARISSPNRSTSEQSANPWKLN
jgi:hypothetical protein